MSFQTFGLHQNLLKQVSTQGYTNPTPIQKESIPVILKGKDVMGLAQTGTGKTAAFALPMLNQFMEGPRGTLRGLIIAPTRELAEQINTNIKELGCRTGLRSTVVYGGVGFHKQAAILKRGVDIVVACPGRLLDHLQQRTISLHTIEMLVLDEADHMFDMGFLPSIRSILHRVPEKRQTLLFSATMPQDIQRLANDILTNPTKISIDHEAPLDSIEHVVYPVEQHLKTKLLLELLKSTNPKSALVFTRTKHRAKSLGVKLQQNGYPAVSLQGNLSQNRRQEALNGFRSGNFKILVATDIAARGIDVSQISHVINYDMPDTPAAYTHRTGRTGRAQRSGEAFTFMTRAEKQHVRILKNQTGIEMKSKTLDGFNYNVEAPKNNSGGRPSNPRQNFRRNPRGR